MSPTFEKWLTEPNSSTEREEISLIEVLAEDAALIEVVRQDKPEKAIQAKSRIISELARHLPPDTLNEIIEENLTDDSTHEEAIIIGQRVLADGASRLIDSRRPHALQQIIDQQIPIRMRDSDTGEIQIIPADDYVARVLEQSETVTLPSGPEAVTNEPDLIPVPLASPDSHTYIAEPLLESHDLASPEQTPRHVPEKTKRQLGFRATLTRMLRVSV